MFVPEEALNYHVVILGVLEPVPPCEPLLPECIAIELGRAFANLGVEPVFANTFSVPVVPRADLMSIHGVWAGMSKSDKATLKLLSPSLAQAIELIAPQPGKTVSAEGNGHPQDSEHPPATVEKDRQHDSSDTEFDEDLLWEE